MVDFNNEATIGTPALDVERISILQRRYELIEAFEGYKRSTFDKIGVSIAVVRARLLSLFIEIQATLKRRLNEDDYNKIKEGCFNSTKENEITEIIFLINQELDAIRLTRIDTQKVYDSTKVETENKAKGF